MMFGELVGGVVCVGGGQGKECMQCLLNDLRALVRYERRPVDDCSPKREGMSQDG